MSPTNAIPGPVGVGGVGGSGTRVIAAIVESLGFDPGVSRNSALDDLTFLALFKRPNAYRDVRGLVPAGDPTAVAATRVFAAVRSGGYRAMTDLVPMVRASISLPSNSASPALSIGFGSMQRRLRRLGRLPAVLRHRPPDGAPWMWKEPNTLIFLPTLFARIGQLRYIHVVRDGLAMATSTNKYQLNNWGRLFGVERDERDDDVRQLIYWARANLAVMDFLDERPESLIVSHERTVSDPAAVAGEIGEFIGAPLTDRTRRVIGDVREPSDFGRTYTVPRQALTPDELADVSRALGRFGYGGIGD